MSKSRVSGVLHHLAAACAALLLAAQAAAQNFPTHTITLVVPYPAGGSVDPILRAMLPEAGKRLGQPLVVENRPGAQGRLALQQQMRARGDGHLLSYATNGNVVTVPLMDPTFQVEPGRDYTPVMPLVLIPMLLVAHPSVPFRDMAGFIAHARAHGTARGFSAGNSGSGGGSHIGMALLADSAKFEITSVAYKNSAPLTTALLANDVQVGFIPPSGKPLVDTGKLIAFLATSPQRLPGFPNLPTAIEAGYPMLNNVGSWTGIVAPPATSRDAVMKLNAALSAALKQPEPSKLIADLGNVSLGGPPEDLTRIIRTDLERMGPLIKKLGLKIE